MEVITLGIESILSIYLPREEAELGGLFKPELTESQEAGLPYNPAQFPCWVGTVFRSPTKIK